MYSPICRVSQNGLALRGHVPLVESHSGQAFGSVVVSLDGCNFDGGMYKCCVGSVCPEGSLTLVSGRWGANTSFDCRKLIKQ